MPTGTECQPNISLYDSTKTSSEMMQKCIIQSNYQLQGLNILVSTMVQLSVDPFVWSCKKI